MFSWLKRKEETDYEKVLSKLESDIRSGEIKLTSYSIRQKRVSFLWTLYCVILYSILILGAIFYFKMTETTYQEKVIALIFVIGFPFVIMIGRMAAVAWFESQRHHQLERLEKLKVTLKEKIEEMKSKTAYYFAKGLIERYDTPTKPSQFSSPSLQQEPSSWVDTLLEGIIGENDSQQHKYALICEECFTHNGLVLPQEYLNCKFACKKCEHLNDKSKTNAVRLRHSQSMNFLPSTPTPNKENIQEKLLTAEQEPRERIAFKQEL